MIIENDGFVGIGTTSPETFLHVKADVHTEWNYHHIDAENHVMIIENTHARGNNTYNYGHNGLAIKLNPGTASGLRDSADFSMNYITFLNKGNNGRLDQNAGAIEGQRYDDLEYDSDYNFTLTAMWYDFEQANVSAAGSMLGAIPVAGSFISGWPRMV